jgi:hypothetical protein
MFSSLRDRFGTAGLVVAIMALVIALVGTAYAASKLNSTQKKEVEKIAKKYAGKKGAPGDPGAPGPQGPAGTNGTNGTNGKDGTNGTNGKGVVIGTAGVACPAGGTTVEVAGEPLTKKNVCNGEEGSPWTAGGTLPEESTETGSWFMPAGSPPQYAAVSFPIPLAADLGATSVIYVPSGGTIPAECENEEHSGTAGPPNPEADPGFFCVYSAAGSIENNAMTIIKAAASEFPGGVGASTAGAVLIGGTTLTGGFAGYVGGTWAVTAP